MPAHASGPTKPNLTLRWILMLVGVIVVFGGVFYIKSMFAKRTNEFFDNMAQPAATITAATAKQERWSNANESVGTLAAVNGIDVTTEAGGVVRAIEFEAGQPVRAGAVLVRLNTANEEAVLHALESTAQLAQAQARRWQELGRDRLVAVDDVQIRTTAAATARAQADAQRALIAQKTIRAPFSGVLGIRRVNLGQFIAPGTAVVSLQQFDPIFLNFSLPEQLIGKLVEGTTVSASVDALPGQTFEGTITAIDPQVDASTRNFTAQATLPNPDNVLRPGSFARVHYDLGGARDVVVIPQTAVSFNPYGNAVFVITKVARKPGETDPRGKPLTGDKLVVTQRFIKTGATRGDLVEVTSGLKPGEQVVTSGLLKLRNGSEVVVNNDVQPSADARPSVENR